MYRPGTYLFCFPSVSIKTKVGGKKCPFTRVRTLADERQEAYAKAMAISFSPRADVLSVPPQHSSGARDNTPVCPDTKIKHQTGFFGKSNVTCERGIATGLYRNASSHAIRSHPDPTSLIVNKEQFWGYASCGSSLLGPLFVSLISSEKIKWRDILWY